jgi:predicted AlkP superfamily pyrophosphatase or phosphodiesterase
MVRALACALLVACAEPPAAPPPACAQPVVLVTIDGVRPDEPFGPRGPELMPNLHRLAARGLAWPEARASGPIFMSLPGYREILSGRPTLGREAFDCDLCGQPTLLDELAGSSVAVVASWDWIDRIAALDKTGFPLSAGRHTGATHDALRVSPDLDDAADSPAFPGVDDYRPDRYTGPLALAALQTLRPCFLYVSLGDTDEYAHRADYPSYLEALADFDQFLGDLDAALLAMHTDAVVVVTTDHGRDRTFVNHGLDPESSRTWIVAAGGPIRHLPTSGIPTACQIAPFLREILQLPHDHSRLACPPL